jgi:hypothetical protein
MNHSLFDAMSLVHVAVGLGFRLFRIQLWLTMLVAVTWEVAEHVLKIHYPQMFVFPSQDSLANAVGDIVCALVGWLLAGRLTRARPGAPPRGPRPGPQTAR